MKDLIITAGFLFSVMLMTGLNAQDRNADSKDHPTTEVNIEKGTSPNSDNQHDSYEKQDREMMQEDAEEEKTRPSSSIDSTIIIPDAETENTVDSSEKNDFDNNERMTDTTDARENESDAERGIGTNSSDSNINYRTGMPSNVTTPEQLKDK